MREKKNLYRMPDELIYADLQKTANAVAEKYPCETCPGWETCNDGQQCYVDYIINLKQRGRDVDVNKLPKQWRWLKEVMI